MNFGQLNHFFPADWLVSQSWSKPLGSSLQISSLVLLSDPFCYGFFEPTALLLTCMMNPMNRLISQSLQMSFFSLWWVHHWLFVSFLWKMIQPMHKSRAFSFFSINFNCVISSSPAHLMHISKKNLFDLQWIYLLNRRVKRKKPSEMRALICFDKFRIQLEFLEIIANCFTRRKKPTIWIGMMLLLL